MRLFDDKARDDRGIRRSGENTFCFLNRVDDVYFGRVRDLVEAWFDRLPVAEQRSFRRRFATSDEAPCDPVFFELYLHEALRRSGLALSYEPPVPGSTHRPDYLATALNTAFYIEAKTVAESRERTASEKRRYGAIETLRKIESRDFTLDLDVVREGTNAPPTRGLVRQVELWLAGLDRAEVERLAKDDYHALPRLVLPAGDWTFSFRPIARPAHRAGVPSPSGAISIFPGRTAGGSDWGRTGDALKEKARRYGDLDHPYVIALLSSGIFVDYEEIVSAIYGEPVFAMSDDGRAGVRATPGRSGGLWSGGANSRVSAVLVARHLTPNSVNKIVPTLWRNPAARNPFEVELPFAAESRLTPTGRIEVDEPKVAPGTFFDLPQEWPGPERPFRSS